MRSVVSNLKGQWMVCLEYSKKTSLILEYGEIMLEADRKGD